MSFLSKVKSQILIVARPLVRWLRPAPLNQLRPMSRRWGHERGTSIGRWYIDRFMERNRKDITGVVLEIKNKRYCDSMGCDVTVADVLDVDKNNKNANIFTDLAQADCVPSEKYDCFILTETLQFVFDLNSAIQHAWRILKPNGVLLVSVPAISPQDKELAEVDCWRFTHRGCKLLFGKVFGEENTHVEPYGNFASSVAGLSGIVVEDIPIEELQTYDSMFTHGVLVRAIKK